MRELGPITLLAKDWEEALRFYVDKLDFVKKRDQVFGENMRWVTVAPSAQSDIEIVFVWADTTR